MFLFHLPGSGPGPGTVVEEGWIGVDLFFVLSGFLITGILLDRRGEGRISSFYVRRVLRIFPLYYFVLAVFFVGLPLLTDDPKLLYPAEQKPWFFLYLQNLFVQLFDASNQGVEPFLSHTWSLAIEEQYYLVWPWIVWFLPRRLVVGLLVTALVGAPAVRWTMLADNTWTTYTTIYTNTLLHVDGLAAGSLLAIVVRSDRCTGKRLARASAALALAFLPISIAVLSNLAENGIVAFPLQPSNRVIATVMYSSLSIGFVGVLGLALTVRSRAVDLALCNPPIVGIGKISYGLYVYHFPLMVLLPRSSGLLLAGLTLAAATLSWFLLERPFLRLKDRFTGGQVAA